MKLRFTSQAALELEQVLNDIVERTPQGASRVQSRIEKTLQLLTEHPYSGRLMGRPTLRRILATPYPYLIFYRIADGEVIVIGVRHAARDPSTMPDPS